MGIPLYTQENLLKFIGGLYSYLCHTILMFNPTNLDEVFVQAIHIESKGKNVHDMFSSTESNQSKEGKGKGKGKYAATLKKEDTNISCSRCQRDGHYEYHCWNLHP